MHTWTSEDGPLGIRPWFCHIRLHLRRCCVVGVGIWQMIGGPMRVPVFSFLMLSMR